MNKQHKITSHLKPAHLMVHVPHIEHIKKAIVQIKDHDGDFEDDFEAGTAIETQYV